MRTINLSGPKGNAYSIIGMAHSFAIQLDKDGNSITDEMKSGNYNNLLDVFDREFPGLVEWVNDPRNPDSYLDEDEWLDDDEY